MGKHGYNHGEIGWCQLNVSDPGKTIDFYSELVGWEKKEAPMPDYHVFANGEESLGGITNIPEGSETPGWIPYITVSDLEAFMAKLESLGGAVVMPPQPLPDGGKLMVFKDPCGGVTGAAQYAAEPDA